MKEEGRWGMNRTLFVEKIIPQIIVVLSLKVCVAQTSEETGGPLKCGFREKWCTYLFFLCKGNKR